MLLWARQSSSVSPSIHTSGEEAAGCTSHASLGNLSPVSRVSLQPCSPQQSSSLLLFQRSPCSRFPWRCNRPHQKGLFGHVSPSSLPRANPAFTSTQLRTFQSSPPPAPQPQLCFWGRCLLRWHPPPALQSTAVLRGHGKAHLPGGRAVGPAPGPAGRVCDGGRGGASGESLPHLPAPLCFLCLVPPSL